MAGRDLSPREVDEVRDLLRRYRLYLGLAVAALGLAVITSVGLLAFFGLKLDARVVESEESFRRVSEETTATMESLTRAVSRQQLELDAIRRAANEDLQAIREAHRKLSAIRDPRRELGALREANEALWDELANQRAELLTRLEEREVESPSDASAGASRFRLGETRFVGASGENGVPKGFLQDDPRIRRATSAPASPGALVIELSPDTLALGEDYELSVRLVNESNGALEAASLRLDWSFGGRNTGGEVPLGASRVDPRKAAVLYAVSGRWSSQHDRGPASVTATVTLGDGARLASTLSW